MVIRGPWVSTEPGSEKRPAQREGVFYVEKTGTEYLNGLLAGFEERGLELVTVVPKISTSLIGLPQTDGLWIFWRRID